MDEVEPTVATVGELVEHLERRRAEAHRHSRRVLHPDREDERDLPLLLRLASARLDRRLEVRLGAQDPDLTLLDPVLAWELGGLGSDGRRALALLLAVLAGG